jgi:hypothetical protein
MGVIGKQRDQGEEQGGENRDPALTVKSQNHRSQPKPWIQDSTGKLSGHPWNHGPGGRPDPARPPRPWAASAGFAAAMQASASESEQCALSCSSAKRPARLLDGLSSGLHTCISWDTLRHGRNKGDACLCRVVCCPA